MTGMAEKTIYTLGTDRRTEEDFIEILLAYEINIVVDVRRFPKSSIPYFNRENLEALLIEHSIRYIHLGKLLGGYRKGGYLQHTFTEEFKKGIDEIERLAKDATVAIICAERFPWRCHRRWIARALQKRHWSVVHIIDKGKLWIPRH